MISPEAHKPDGARNRRHERRQENRYARSIPIFLEVRDNIHDLDSRPHIVKGYATNFSRHGFQIVTGRPLVGGERLRLYVLESKRGALTLISEVRWSRLEGNRYRQGFYLLEVKNTDYLLWWNQAARAAIDLEPETTGREDAPATP